MRDKVEKVVEILKGLLLPQPKLVPVRVRAK